MSSTRMPSAAIAASALLAGFAPTLHADEVFAFSVNTATSTLAADVAASADIAGNLQGNTAATPPTRTKTPPQNFFTCGIQPEENDLVPISATLQVAGSTGAGAQPSGAFRLGINTTALTASASGFSVDLLGEATLDVAATLQGLHLPSFCTANPSCHLPIPLTFDLPLGNITLVGIQAVQEPGDAAGTLVVNPNGGWDFAIPMSTLVSTQVTFGGEPFPTDPQVVPVILAGTIIITGDSATVTTNIVIDFEPAPGDTPLEIPPTALPPTSGLPICNGMNLLMSGMANNAMVSIHSAAMLAAAGSRVACGCDWNHSGAVSVQDLFDYLGAFFSGAADFNGVGGTTVQDLFDFLSCWFGRPPECR